MAIIIKQGKVIVDGRVIPQRHPATIVGIRKQLSRGGIGTRETSTGALVVTDTPANLVRGNVPSGIAAQAGPGMVVVRSGPSSFTEISIAEFNRRVGIQIAKSIKSTPVSSPSPEAVQKSRDIADRNRLITDARRVGLPVSVRGDTVIVGSGKSAQVVKIGSRRLDSIGERAKVLTKTEALRRANLAGLTPTQTSNFVRLATSKKNIAKVGTSAIIGRIRSIPSSVSVRDFPKPTVVERAAPVEKKKLLQKIDELRRKPFIAIEERLRVSSEIGEYIKQQKRLGKKITKRERAALLFSGMQTAGARTERAIASVLLTPDDIVKGLATLGKDAFKSIISFKLVGSVDAILDEFKRDPVGTFIEFYVAKKVIGLGLKGVGKITSATIGKTAVGRGAASAAKATAAKLRAIAKKAPGAKGVAAIVRSASKLKKAAKTRIFRNRAVRAVVRAAKKVKRFEPKRLTLKASREAGAKAVARKILANNKAIKLAKGRPGKIANLKRASASFAKRIRETYKMSVSKAIRLLKKERRISLKKSKQIGRKAGKEIKKVGKPSKVPKIKKVLRIKLKPKLLKKIIRLEKKVDAKIARFQSRLTKPVRNVLSKINRTIGKFGAETARQIIIIKVRILNAFNKIKNPTVKQTRAFIKRLIKLDNKLDRIISKKVTKPIIRGGRIVKKAITKRGRVIKRKVIAKAKRTARLAERREQLAIKKLNKIINKAGLKIIKIKKAIGKLTSNVIKPIINKANLIAKLLKKSKGRLTRAINRQISLIKRKLPVEFKLKKILPKKPRLEKVPRRIPRIPKRLSNIELAKLILKRKIKLKRIPSGVRKSMRKLLRRAAEKKAKGLSERQLRKIRGKERKAAIAKRRAELGPERARFIAERNRAIRDRIKSQKMVEQMRKDIKQNKPLPKLADDFKKAEAQRGVLKKDAIRIKKSPFNPKEKIMEIKKLNQADNKLQSAERSIQGQGLKTVQILKQRQMTKLKTDVSKGKSGINKKLSAVKTRLSSELKAVRVLKLPKAIRSITAQLLAIGALVARLPKGKIRTRGGVRAITTAKPKAKVILKSTAISAIKPIQEKVPVVIPNINVAQAPVSSQTQIINQLLGLAAGTSAVLIGGRSFRVKTPSSKAGFAAWRKRIRKLLKTRRFIFLPDMFSLVFGIKAKPGQRVILLRRGRIFTGAERRPIVLGKKRR